MSSSSTETLPYTVQTEDDDNKSQREFWFMFRRRQRWIFQCAMALTLMAAIVIFVWPYSYRAESTIMVESKDAKVVSIQEVYDSGSEQSGYLQTQYEVLKSRELAEKVIKELDLTHNPVFIGKHRQNDQWWSFPKNLVTKNKVSTEDAVFQNVLQQFSDHLDVTPIRNTQLVKIAYESPDPHLSANIINALARIYIENELESRLDMTRTAATWINSRMAGLREQLEASEKALQDYREQENLLEVGGVRTLATQELNELTTKLVDARRKRTEAENIVEQVGQDSSSNPAVLQHPLLQRLKEQEMLAQQKLSELSKRYGPKHPKIIAVNSELEAAKKSYEEQTARVIEGVRREYQIAKATEGSLTASLAGMKGEMQGINRKEYKLSELERSVTVNRQLYDTFFSRMKETAETENLPTAHARIIDRAIAPDEPSSSRWLLLLLAASLSSVLSVFSAYLRDKYDDTISNPEDVRHRLGESLLGILPLLKNREQAALAATAFSRNGAGSFAESVRTIRTGILVQESAEQDRIILVTSALPGEGKSVIASNLALAFGKMGKVLLIDADLRRPAAARNFGLLDVTVGLSGFLKDKAPISECIYHLEKQGVDLMPAGIAVENPLELLSSVKFSDLLMSLRSQYDHIIIDSAPCEAVSDALALSSLVDAAIFVVRAGVTPRKAVLSGITRLREAGNPLKGVVLNYVDIEKGLRVGYYFGGYYGSYSR